MDIEKIVQFYDGNWAGFSFVDGNSNFRVIDKTNYDSGKWYMVYDNPTDKISGGGILISEFELREKLLDIAIEYIKGLQS